MIWNMIGVFVAMIAVDIIWTAYIKTIAQGEASAAAFWSLLVMLVGAYVTIQYVHDPLMLVPAGLGAAVGTYVAVKFWKKADEIDEEDGINTKED